jgi:Xaa-Pro aminopeptidase
VVSAAGIASRVDRDRLRRDRRHRLFEAMAGAGVDVLVLGRPPNIQYASGAQQLWTAGTRPFGPACIVVGDTGRVHLLSTWDEGVPPEIGHEDLFGLSWNPAITTARLQAIPGLAGAAVVATDGFSPGAAQLLATLCPDAAIVDAGALLAGARTTKTPDELACIAAAARTAQAALWALEGALEPGVTERELLGVYAAAIATLGAPAPPTEAVVCATPRRGPARRRRLAGDRAIGPGELVAFSPGAFSGGYEASVARTRIAGELEPSAAQRRLRERSRAVLAAVVAACRPGATGADLCQAWAATGESPPSEPFAWGVGLGMEPPIISAELGATAALTVASVLAVEAWLAADDAGGVLVQDLVLITDGAPEVLTHYPAEAVDG